MGQEYEYSPFSTVLQLERQVFFSGNYGATAWFGLVYWGLTPQQQPGLYEGGEMTMMNNNASNSMCCTGPCTRNVQYTILAYTRGLIALSHTIFDIRSRQVYRISMFRPSA